MTADQRQQTEFLVVKMLLIELWAQAVTADPKLQNRLPEIVERTANTVDEVLRLPRTRDNLGARNEITQHARALAAMITGLSGKH